MVVAALQDGFCPQDAEPVVRGLLHHHGFSVEVIYACARTVGKEQSGRIVAIDEGIGVGLAQDIAAPGIFLVRINKHENLIMYKSVGEVESDRTDFVYNFYIYCTP